MGDLFSTGNQNTIFKLRNDKVPTQEFVNYIKTYAPIDKEMNSSLINEMLYDFVGEKLMEKEIENFQIKLSDNSLSTIIKNQEIFKKDKVFSRTEYEKFLVTNSLNAVAFEKYILEKQKKNQILNLIGGGIAPSKFMVNLSFDQINQKRNIQVINLTDFFKKKIKITDNEIKNYFDANIDNYKSIYKHIKFAELNSKNLTNSNEFSDLFFKKIDEIDDLIVEGKNIDYILNKYNIDLSKTIIIDDQGKDKNLKVVKDLPSKIIKSIFQIDEFEPTKLIAYEDFFFVFEHIKTEDVQGKIENNSVYKNIESLLKKKSKMTLASNFISKINKNEFNKSDFNKLSTDENLQIKKIKIENLNDNKILKKDIVKQIYNFPEKKVIIVADFDFNESYLVYIDNVENTIIKDKSKNYKKYLELAKNETTNLLYSTYDKYLKNKYEIEINYKALESINNQFR
tara:strand:- start:1545 stop:2906 length:1362 start_codon:yes stop_codon:yes gene_type:complete